MNSILESVITFRRPSLHQNGQGAVTDPVECVDAAGCMKCGDLIEYPFERDRIVGVYASPSEPALMFLLRHTIAWLRQTVQTVGGVVAWIRSNHHRINPTRLAVLVMYLVVNLGLPIGDFTPRAGAASVAKECRCSPASRAAGRCCCRKGPGSAGTARTGCCAVPAKPESKSCCAKKSGDTKQPVQVQIPVTEQMLAWTSDCPCGPVDSPVLLICPQPRILVDIAAFDGVSVACIHLFDCDCVPCGDRSQPCVPPPESSFDGLAVLSSRT